MKVAIKHITEQQFSTAPVRVENYCIYMLQGEGDFVVDGTPYSYKGNTLLFLTPFQYFQWVAASHKEAVLLQFHGDFYCIEYHKKEVACNGLLFNALFLQPHIIVSEGVYAEIQTLFTRIEAEVASLSPYSEAVLRSYLQLILALSSKAKGEQIEDVPTEADHRLATDFQQLLETHFIDQRELPFYAEALHLTPDSFSKKIKKQLGKTPTQLLQERLVLEAKKQLHLTYKSIKEVAFYLNFDDPFYFSRFFKKHVGVSPKSFREHVGISIVAEKSM